MRLLLLLLLSAAAAANAASEEEGGEGDSSEGSGEESDGKNVTEAYNAYRRAEADTRAMAGRLSYQVSSLRTYAHRLDKQLREMRRSAVDGAATEADAAVAVADAAAAADAANAAEALRAEQSGVCGHGDCAACTADPRCGWCIVAGQCHRGDAFGPFAAQCTLWTYTHCPGERHSVMRADRAHHHKRTRSQLQ
jgi:hypothetical protein